MLRAQQEPIGAQEFPHFDGFRTFARTGEHLSGLLYGSLNILPLHQLKGPVIGQFTGEKGHQSCASLLEIQFFSEDREAGDGQTDGVIRPVGE